MARRRLLVLAVALAVLGTRANAVASLADLRAQAQAVAITPGAGGPGEEAAIERLGRLALAFLDAVDTEGGAGAVSAYEAIAGPLQRSYEAHRAAMDGMARSVIENDGNIDVVYDSAAWKEHQSLAAAALYYLNWLRYRGALLYDGSKRKTLLEQAATGFGEFTSGDGDNPVVVESHLGRGLAYLQLDRPDWAIPELEALAQSKGAGADKIQKARLALGEAYLKAGRSADALRVSKQALESAGPADRPRAAFTRARALCCVAMAQPGQRDATLAEARDLLASLQSAGGPWGNRAAQLLRMGLTNPAVCAGPKLKEAPPPPPEWDVTKRYVATGKLKEAIPRLEQVLASSDEEDRGHQAEARYLLGLCRFRLGDYAGAATTFDQVLAEHDKASYRDDAAYLRFKAREALYAADPKEERAAELEQAIVQLLRDYPQHKAAGEARFRLGELRQRQERWAEAIAEYGRVRGDASFELRATFGLAQCSLKLLERTPEGQTPDPQLRRQAMDALARFWTEIAAHDFKDFGDTPVNDLMGQAALMNAYLVALAEPPDYAQAVDWLAGFEERYPKLIEQRTPVVKLRLAALVRLDRLEDAARDAARPEVAALDPTLLDGLASRLLTTAAREQAAGHAAAAAAGRAAALRLCEAALASKDAATLTPAVRRRLQSTLASSYETAGRRDEALVLYRTILREDPDVVSARSGAARILEADGKTTEARALWDEVMDAPQGRAGWLEAHYHSARLSAALGDTTRACTVLHQVPPQMLVNASSDTPRKIQDLLRELCKAS